MPGLLLKPADFDSTKKSRPAARRPGDRGVKDAGAATSRTRLTQKGTWAPAHAGAARRGPQTMGTGVIETGDQAVAAQALRQRPYVDPSRIGIWGWSYGGFMSLNVLFQHPDIYRTAVAVSPVTNWKLYDNVYTERFNGLITDNKAGYERGSPVTYVNGLPGNLLLVHGGGRRQRPLPEQRDPDQRPRRRQQAVHDDGIPQPDPLHLPGKEHRPPSLLPHYQVSRPEPDESHRHRRSGVARASTGP